MSFVPKRLRTLLVSAGLVAVCHVTPLSATDADVSERPRLPAKTLARVLVPKSVIAAAQTHTLYRPVKVVRRGRPMTLPALYASLAALQVADIHSTALALDRGAREGNPVLAAFGSNKPAAIAVKAAATAGMIYLTERIWKQEKRKSAVITMIAINTAYLAVAASNYRIAKQYAEK